MKKKFGKLLTAAFMICAVGSFFSSCNDYVSDVNAELQGQIADLNANLVQDLSDLKDDLLDELTQCKQDCTDETTRLEGLIGTNAEGIQANTDSIMNLLQDIADLTGRVEVLEDAKIKVDSTLNALDSIQTIHADSIANFYKTYATMSYVKAAIGDSLVNIRTEINTAFSAALDSVGKVSVDVKANAAEIESLKQELAKIKSCNCDTAAIWNKIRENESKITGLQTQVLALDLLVAGAMVTLGEHTTKITNLEEADKLIKEDIKNLQTAVDELREDITALEDRMDIVEDRLNKRISSVVVNGAYSPVIGYFNLPTGAKSNILAAYYNTIASPAAELKFPTIRTANYVDPAAAFSDAEAALLGFAETTYGAKNDVLVGTEGNAGKIYLTINPNDVDTTGVQLKLKNSIGEESAMILGPLTKSDEKLSFGYTRAATNGFYEVSATMQADAIEKAKIRIELEDLKTVVKDFASIGDGVNLTNAITTLYAAVNDIADAYAVEAIYTDTLGEHSVYSDYGLAAVAIKPLSYNSLADLNVTSFPGMGRVSNLVNKVFDKVGTISIPDFGLTDLQTKLEAIDFAGVIGDSIKFNVKLSKTIEYTLNEEVDVPIADVTEVWTTPIIVPVYDGGVKIGEVEVPAQKVEINKSDIVNGKVTINKTLQIPVEFDETIALPSEEVLGDLGTTLDDVDALLSDVNDLLKNFNTKIDNAEGKLNNAITKVEGKLNSFLDKLNSKLCAILNSVNSKLQPTMLLSTTDGFSLTSSIKGAPSQVSATSFTLVPTSYTAEILAPAFKKYVAVTAAYDKNGNLDNNAAKAANTGDLNTVLDGHTRAISFNGQSGYTYEITYSAVDFSGYISNTKYYIEVK